MKIFKALFIIGAAVALVYIGTNELDRDFWKNKAASDTNERSLVQGFYGESAIGTGALGQVNFEKLALKVKSAFRPPRIVKYWTGGEEEPDPLEVSDREELNQLIEEVEE